MSELSPHQRDNMKLRVKENEKYVRDSNNLAILNTDENALKKHELKMEQLRKQKERDKEIESIRNDLAELKQLLRDLVNGK